MINKIFTLCTLGFMLACSGPQTEMETERVIVDFKAPEPTLKVERIIQLETNNEALFDQFYRVKIAGRNILVQDQFKIVVYDLNGKYLSKVQKVGHGPQEYITISNFWAFRDELYVVTNAKKGVLVYSLTGKYLRTIPLDFAPEAIAVMENYMAFKSAYNQDGTLIVTDREGREKYEMIAPILAKTTVSIPAVFPFTESDGKVYYFPDFSSSIYTVGPDTSDVKQIKLDFGVHTITPEFAQTLTAGTFMDEFEKHGIVSFPSFYPTRDWWGMVFSLGDKEYSWYYHAKNGKQYIVEAPGIISVKPIACTTEDYFVEVAEAAEFLASPRYAAYRQGLKVDENDNPLLIFYSIQ